MSDDNRIECVNANCRMQFPPIGGIKFKFCPSCGCRQPQAFTEEADGQGTPSDNAGRSGIFLQVDQSKDQSGGREGLREKASNSSENPQGSTLGVSNGGASLRSAMSTEEPATVVRPPSCDHQSLVDPGKALVAEQYDSEQINESQTSANADVDASSTHTREHQERNIDISLDRDEKSTTVSVIKDTGVKTSSSSTSKDQVCCFGYRLISLVSRSIDRIVHMHWRICCDVLLQVKFIIAIELFWSGEGGILARMSINSTLSMYIATIVYIGMEDTGEVYPILGP